LPQIFHRNSNHQTKYAIVGFVLFAGLAFGAANLAYWGPYVTGQGIPVVQPVQFTHSHHVGGLGIDCRYCHFGVERSPVAQVPPTRVCMNCHSMLYTEEQILEPVRESYRSDMPVKWNRVHNLSDFVYFNHSAHINKGVGCADCHGRVDQMPLMYQENTLHMAWCLQCHFEPEKSIRPKSEITNMEYKHPKTTSDTLMLNGEVLMVHGKQMTQNDLAQAYNVNSKVSCSTCHR
jgi:hypothetical protein